MRCETVQIELSTGIEPVSPLTRWRIARHLTTCAGCQAYRTQMARLDAVVTEWRTDAPPAALQNRIAESLRQSAALSPTFAPVDSKPAVAKPSYPRSRTMKRTLSFAAVLLVAAVFTLNLIGKPVSAAAAIRRMQEAIAHARTVHVTTFNREYKTDNGYEQSTNPTIPFQEVEHRFPTLQKTEEEWYTDGKWRKEGVYGTRIIKNGHYYRRNPKTRQIPDVQESGEQRSTTFSLSQILGEEAKLLGTTTQNGKTINTYEINEGTNRRELCQIDTTTNLPVQIEMQSKVNGVWSAGWREEFEFNQELPASLFDPESLP